MTEGTVDTPQINRRKIIERPRLTRLLDESPARIKMLIAPAGYGKTTLARQWLTAGRQSTWCVCGRQSQDIAALTASIVEAMNAVVPGVGDRAEQRVRMAEDPARDVDSLAALLIEDADDWPEDAWLVIDDYQELLGVPSAESFIAHLADSVSVPVLICSRERPSWATARRVLYEEILELSSDCLVLNSQEIEAVLGRNWIGDEATVHQAAGWPALIGLASLTSSTGEFDADLPETLYSFFADEVYRALPEARRAQYREIALLPTLDESVIREIYGEETRGEVLEHGRRAGIITPAARGDAWEIHPLFRQYLRSKTEESTDQTRAFRRELVAAFSRQRAWDHAFAVAEPLLDLELLARIMENALDDLLQAGRSTTLKSWVQARTALGTHAPIDSIVSAELRFREGHYGEAQHLAVTASESSSGEIQARAYLIAGRAAHLASREEDALRFSQLAQAASEEPALRERAMWGELSAAVDMELPEAVDLLEQLRGRRRDPEHVINVVTKQMMLECRLGRVGDLDPARAAERHIELVKDPLVRCSFRNTLANSLALKGDYDECLAVSERLTADATQSRLEFVMPYAQGNEVLALAALRREGEALRLHAVAYESARRLRDEHARLNLEAILARIHFAASRYDEAAQALRSRSQTAIRSMRGEYLATRALIAAANGDLAEAKSFAARADHTSRSVEVRVLSAGAKAVAATRSGDNLASTRIRELVLASGMSGNVDCLITIYRGCPEIVGSVFDRPTYESLREVMTEHGDVDLANALQSLDDTRRLRPSTLSPREREVAQLIQRGLSNSEIAAALFISSSTAKVHVHHILEKLGLRSRVEIALRLTAEQNQATSTARGTGNEVSSAAVPNVNIGPDALR